MAWQGKRVLVTGASGFIGSHLTERLVQLGATTRAFVHYRSEGAYGWLNASRYRSDIEFVIGDVRDRDTVRDAVQGCEVVFHLAATVTIPYSYRAPASYLQTNVLGTSNLLQEVRATGIERFVHTSTSEVYGTPRTLPITEAHPLQAQSPYAASKVAADQLVYAHHCSFDLPVTTLRPFNTYGPRQSARALIPTIVGQALADRTLELGNLRPTRDFTFVSDTVEGFLRLAECPNAVGEVVQVGSGQEISVGELAQRVLTSLNKDLRVVAKEERVRPAGSEVLRLVADPSKARRLIDWSPQVRLTDGLERTRAWIERTADPSRAHEYRY